MSIMLNSIELPADLVFVDEFDWHPVVQAFARAENGVQVREESAITAGRPITLAGDERSAWITRAVLIDLQTLAATAGGTHTLALADGRTFSVAFVYPKPIEAQLIVDYAQPVLADWYSFVLHLITV